MPLALVHHANQFLIRDDYDNREGITEVVEGYAAVLRLHERFAVPISLHMSGTLIESFAWYHPEFLELVRALRARGLVDLIGGVYGENIMPLFPQSFNRRQLDELLWLYRHHLGCPPSTVKVAWVTERVWETSTIAPVLTAVDLANGGYRYVLLDDRLLFPVGDSYAGSPRALFDQSGPYGAEVGSYQESHRRFPSYFAIRPWLAAGSRGDRSPSLCARALEEISRPYRIAGGNSLTIVPISANLRYWVPPSSREHWQGLEETVRLVAGNSRADKLLVYADDLEKTTGVGPWQSDSLAHYEDLLRWVVARQDVRPVNLSAWLREHPVQDERVVERGTYFELAQAWQAGEDYRSWSDGATWAQCQHYFARAHAAVSAAEESGGDAHLLSLAWKHLLASSWETAWHDTGNGAPAPAPWARAVASHSRAARVMAAAASWFATPERCAEAEVTDVDDDGEGEVVLRNEHLYAVVSPHQGGRLVYLFALTPQGGAQVIGNPTDDWNWQEELNKYMIQPPNHPGALADRGCEHDHYQVVALREVDGSVSVEMANGEEESRLFGARKRLLLAANARALFVCYDTANEGSLATSACLAPDYYRLLREGRQGVTWLQGDRWRGWRHQHAIVWLGLAPGEGTNWVPPAQEEAGHCRNLAVAAQSSHFHVLVGSGDVDPHDYERLLARGKAALHGTLVRPPARKRRTLWPPAGRGLPNQKARSSRKVRLHSRRGGRR